MPNICVPEMDGDCMVYCPATCRPGDIVCTNGFDKDGEKRDLDWLH